MKTYSYYQFPLEILESLVKIMIHEVVLHYGSLALKPSNFGAVFAAGRKICWKTEKKNVLGEFKPVISW